MPEGRAGARVSVYRWLRFRPFEGDAPISRWSAWEEPMLPGRNGLSEFRVSKTAVLADRAREAVARCRVVEAGGVGGERDDCWQDVFSLGPVGQLRGLGDEAEGAEGG